MGDVEFPCWRVTFTDKHDGEKRYVLVFAPDATQAQEAARHACRDHEHVLRLEPAKALVRA